MHIYIFANEKDHSIKLVQNELKSRSVLYSRYRFCDLSIVSNNLYIGGEKFSPKKSDRILMRSPWNTPYFTQDYTVLARFIAEYYKDYLAFDGECYRKHLPFYQDKLYQGLLYKSQEIQTPNVWYFESEKYMDVDTIPLPVVIKHRTSARSRNNYLIKTKKELKAYVSNIPLKKWYFQEYIKTKRDIRVNVLKGKVLQVFERATQIKDKNRLVVSGGKLIDKIHPTLTRNALKITKVLGADFVGVDFLESKKGQYYLIEVNLSPQFTSTAPKTSVDVVESITDAIVS